MKVSVKVVHDRHIVPETRSASVQFGTRHRGLGALADWYTATIAQWQAALQALVDGGAPLDAEVYATDAYGIRTTWRVE